MSRFGVIGDLHGNSKWATHVLNELGARSIQTAFVVGDFGLWGGLDGVKFLDDVQEAAARNRLSVLAIPGNHEAFSILEHYQAHAPTSRGFHYLRSRVLMSPKANSFTMFGKKFVVAGGAVSIDKGYRLAKERGGWYEGPWGRQDLGRGTGHRTLWWPQEQLTDDEEELIKSFGQCDILLTHDASDHTPWKSRLKPDLDSQLHRERIDRILKATRPEVHFHGHFHTKYEWLNSRSHGFYDEDEPGAFGTRTYGLECDGMDDSWLIFDTETNEAAFQGIGMNFRGLGD